jgi:hypothetical protein
MFAMGSGIPAFIFLVWILVKGVKVLSAGAKYLAAGAGFRIAVALVVVGFWVCAFFNYLFTGSLAYLFFILLAGGISLCLSSPAQDQSRIENLEVRKQQTSITP